MSMSTPLPSLVQCRVLFYTIMTAALWPRPCRPLGSIASRCACRSMDGTRNRTQRFSAMLSHYVIGDRYGRPGKGERARACSPLVQEQWTSGKVEGLVGYGRRNFMVPIPRFSSWEAFNEHLEAKCRKNRERRLRRHTETIGERFERDAKALLPLPSTPYDACDKRTTRVTSLSLVRY